MVPTFSRWRVGRRGLVALGLVLILLVVLFRIRFLFTMVVGSSMSPNLESGDLLLVDKSAYRTAEPKRGDVVIVRVRNELIVKRVIALPGEMVEVRQGVLYINRAEYAEDHPILTGELDIGSGTLSRGKFAILGDNRTRPVWLSAYAVVAKNQIVGKVLGDLSWHRGAKQ